MCNHKRKRNVGGVIPPGANSPSQSYENNVSDNFTNRHIVTNYCNPAGIKKYGFGEYSGVMKKPIVKNKMNANDLLVLR